VGVGSGGYASHYGASYWWYDDYYGYWHDYYPWCCDHQGDFDELIKKWWSGLDPQRQQEIKEKYQDWQENQGQPDVAALRGDLAGRWNAMTPEQQQALRDNRQSRPSVSNPDRAPRSPLDDRGNRLTTPGNGLLTTPGARPDTTPGVQPRPHLPGSLATPNRPLAQPGTVAQPRPVVQPRPMVQPRVAPPMRSFPAIRRR